MEVPVHSFCRQIRLELNQDFLLALVPSAVYIRRDVRPVLVQVACSLKFLVCSAITGVIACVCTSLYGRTKRAVWWGAFTIVEVSGCRIGHSPRRFMLHLLRGVSIQKFRSLIRMIFREGTSLEHRTKANSDAVQVRFCWAAKSATPLLDPAWPYQDVVFSHRSEPQRHNTNPQRHAWNHRLPLSITYMYRC